LISPDVHALYSLPFEPPTPAKQIPGLDHTQDDGTDSNKGWPTNVTKYSFQLFFFFAILLDHWLAQTLSQRLPTTPKQYGTPKLYHVEIIRAEFSLMV